MGSLMVRSGGGMPVVVKVAVGVVICYAALQLLPFILGASFLAGLLGLAVVGFAITAVTALLNLAIYLGVPLLIILVILSFVGGDD